jgi:hypothetical protein
MAEEEKKRQTKKKIINRMLLDFCLFMPIADAGQK